jgi:hypothetical protein
VRAVLSEAICVVSSEGYGQTLITTDRRRCGATDESRLTRAVDAALTDAGLVLIALPLDPPYRTVPATPEEATRLVREYYLSSPVYLRSVLRRLPAALEAEGLTCVDCPPSDATVTTSISWSEFLPYVTAHVWPNPVETPRGPDGLPSGRPRFGYHVCAGNNGLDKMEHPDPLLARAGFLAAAESPALKDRARTLFQEIVNDPELERLVDDEARTEHIRRRMAESLSEDPVVKEAACATLSRRGGDLALAVTDCSTPAPAPPTADEDRLSPATP